MLPGSPVTFYTRFQLQRFVMGFFMILSQVIEYQLDKILYDFSRIV